MGSIGSKWSSKNIFADQETKKANAQQLELWKTDLAHRRAQCPLEAVGPEWHPQFKVQEVCLGTDNSVKNCSQIHRRRNTSDMDNATSQSLERRIKREVHGTRMEPGDQGNRVQPLGWPSSGSWPPPPADEDPGGCGDGSHDWEPWLCSRLPAPALAQF